MDTETNQTPEEPSSGMSLESSRTPELPAAIEAMNFTANCPDCNGIGSDENAGFWCSRCKGEGWVFLTQEWKRLPEASLNESNLRSQEGSDAI